MDRRLYFLLPDPPHALAVVNELAQAGIDPERVHALADTRVDLGDLPRGSARQINDSARRLEAVLWDGNLVIFGLALGVLAMLLAGGRVDAWLLVPLGVMLASLLAGLRFTRLPNTHLDEFRDALAHGEVLLMVDVQPARVADIEHRVHHRHPEVAVGGVGWGTRAFGL